MIDNSKKPLVFISHSWKDNSIVKKLDTALKTAGAQVWVDYSNVRIGKNIPKEISNALEQCDVVLLIWSKYAKSSHWIELEWTNAISLKKDLVPCLIDDSELPPLLANKHFFRLSDQTESLLDLLKALNLKTNGAEIELSHPKRTWRFRAGISASTLLLLFIAFYFIGKSPTEEAEDSSLSSQSDEINVPPERPYPERQQEGPNKKGTKPASKENQTQENNEIPRHPPEEKLSRQEFEQMLLKENFYDYMGNRIGQGTSNKYRTVSLRGDTIVIDDATGLMWQQSGSPNIITYNEAKDYIENLKKTKYAGYNDWRLPKLKEVLTVLESEKKNGNLNIDPVFKQRQTEVWTSTKENANKIWTVWFVDGYSHSYPLAEAYYRFARAVRSISNDALTKK